MSQVATFDWLRIHQPDVALALENEYLRVILEDQEQYMVDFFVAGTEARIHLSMERGYHLILRPALPGYHGYRSWMEMPRPGSRAVVRQGTLEPSGLWLEAEILTRSGLGEPVSLLKFPVRGFEWRMLVAEIDRVLSNQLGLKITILHRDADNEF